MRIIVVGAGVIGVTSTWYLSQAGHDVTVIDNHVSAAEGTSFANAGLLSVGHSAPNAAPGAISMVIKSFFQKDSPIKIRPDLSFYQTRWLLQNLSQCTKKRFSINQARMIHIAQLTRGLMLDLKKQTGIEFEGQKQGIMQVCRTSEQITAAKGQQAMLQNLGIPSDLLTKEEVIAVEPGLAYATYPIAGGLRLTEEECGDCALFTKSLAEVAAKSGVKFIYNAQVKQLLKKEDKLTSITLEEQGQLKEMDADAFVIAAGAKTHHILKGIAHIPVYPVKGTSITLQVNNGDKALQHAMFDTLSSIAITRFDNRVRLAGFAQFMGFDDRINPYEVETLVNSYKNWFPNSTDLERTNAWVGFRPMTPDGTPIISKTPLSNLYVNTGQGTYGFTMGCGSAHLLQQIIDNQVSDADVANYSLNRD